MSSTYETLKGQCPDCHSFATALVKGSNYHHYICHDCECVFGRKREAYDPDEEVIEGVMSSIYEDSPLTLPSVDLCHYNKGDKVEDVILKGNKIIIVGRRVSQELFVKLFVLEDKMVREL